MPAFNSARWVGAAIDSILGQTFQSLELIVIDDASTDGTAETVSAVRDGRVALVRLDRNSGSAAARNAGLERATGEFVALMDSDDVALPHWLERQVRFLESDPQTGLCGAWIRAFGAREGVWTAYESHEHIKADLLFRSGMNQNTVVFRREQFASLGLRYDTTLAVAEDYDLWTRCADVMRMHNTQEVLVEYRLHDSNSSTVNKPLMQEFSRRTRSRQLAKLGIVPSEQDLDMQDALGEYGPSGPRQRDFDVDALERWLLKLREANARSRYVSHDVLGILLYEYWRRCCKPRSAWPGFPLARFLTSEIVSGIPHGRRYKDAIKMLAGGELYSLPRSESVAQMVTEPGSR